MLYRTSYKPSIPLGNKECQPMIEICNIAIQRYAENWTIIYQDYVDFFATA